jgi:hypothetical protein
LTDDSGRTDDDIIGGAALSSLGVRPKSPNREAAPAAPASPARQERSVELGGDDGPVRRVRPPVGFDEPPDLAPVPTAAVVPPTMGIPWHVAIAVAALVVAASGIGWMSIAPPELGPALSAPAAATNTARSDEVVAVSSAPSPASEPVESMVAAGDEIFDEVAEREPEEIDDSSPLLPLYASARYGPPAPIAAAAPAWRLPTRNNKLAPSASVGRPSRGRLRAGVKMPEGLGYVLRFPHRAYGTRHTVDILVRALKTAKARFPDAHSLAVGDISLENGGTMRPHRSHQTGRDADISYYVLGDPGDRTFPTPTAETIDAEKVWFLFETLLGTGMVEYIFVDYPLQKPIYERALAQGHTAEELEHVFEYPRRKYSGGATIRHSRGHDDHFHIRVACRDDDETCK